MQMPITTDPALLAGYVAARLAKWVVSHATTESAWKFDTSASVGVAVGAAKYAFVGAQGGGIWLHREGHEPVTLKYFVGGAGVGVSPPAQLVTTTGSLPSFPSDGALRVVRGERDFDDGRDFTMPYVGLVGPCALLQFDGNLLFGGVSAAVMLVGVNAALEGMLRQLARTSQHLVALVRARPPRGFFPRAVDAVTRPLREDYDVAKIAFDVFNVLARLEFGTWFRAALFFRGLEESAAAPQIVTASAGIAAYFGLVNA
ncbi:MAG TPA: hypothetical protein VHB21_06135 [Minicystis sp.]|nr:hypothetical protein [Minicystis sp.]